MKNNTNQLKINLLKEIKNADGTRGSSVLPAHVVNYLVDIDGTVGEDIPNEESWRMKDAKVFPEALKIVNKWFDEGHVVTFFTSRTETHRVVTERWLAQHGFKYHGLLMGKPRGGNYHWIDDRPVTATHLRDGLICEETFFTKVDFSVFK